MQRLGSGRRRRWHTSACRERLASARQLPLRAATAAKIVDFSKFPLDSFPRMLMRHRVCSIGLHGCPFLPPTLLASWMLDEFVRIFSRQFCCHSRAGYASHIDALMLPHWRDIMARAQFSPGCLFLRTMPRYQAS